MLARHRHDEQDLLRGRPPPRIRPPILPFPFMTATRIIFRTGRATRCAHFHVTAVIPAPALGSAMLAASSMGRTLVVAFIAAA